MSFVLPNNSSIADKMLDVKMLVIEGDESYVSADTADLRIEFGDGNVPDVALAIMIDDSAAAGSEFLYSVTSAKVDTDASNQTNRLDITMPANPDLANDKFIIYFK